MNYITVAQVDALLGAGWAGTGDPARAVLMANTWLSAKPLPAFEEVPAAVVQAGAEIAREAATGALYGASSREVLSETKTVDGAVSKSTTYAAGGKAVTAGEAFAMALLRPYLGGNQVRLIRG
ncbi:DnaT-like ssDNA-binding protein [Pseudidiomarina sp.]|uniref:DnaT-like ssDNA-binding protein n=1 Tax=Pseudidiomarina sp. TaxID=2081707 RepID=UPI003A976062